MVISLLILFCAWYSHRSVSSLKFAFIQKKISNCPFSNDINWNEIEFIGFSCLHFSNWKKKTLKQIDKEKSVDEEENNFDLDSIISQHRAISLLFWIAFDPVFVHWTKFKFYWISTVCFLFLPLPWIGPFFCVPQRISQGLKLLWNAIKMILSKWCEQIL